MAIRVEPTTAGDLDAIARLLTTAFGAPADAPFVDPDLLRWKYLEPVGRGQVPRSYVLRQGGDVVAHCAMMPLAFRVRQNAAASRGVHIVSGVCFLDWAGDRRLPGAGIILLKKLMALTDISFVAAGSDEARAVVPKLGFIERQSVDLFAKVIRPLRQARSRPRTGRWRDGLRLVRNALWSLAPHGRLEPEWRATPAKRFITLPPVESNGPLAPERAPDSLNYWLRCPAATMSGFEIRRRDVMIGHFLLSRVGGQSRVADLRLYGGAPADLVMAYRLALRTAARDRATCEVVGIGSTEPIRAALGACGFRRRGAAPLFVHDRRGVLGEPPIVWSMIDDDTAYVYDPSNPYST